MWQRKCILKHGKSNPGAYWSRQLLKEALKMTLTKVQAIDCYLLDAPVDRHTEQE